MQNEANNWIGSSHPWVTRFRAI